jgi:DNA-binding SARP family transcriptional activator
MRCSAATPPGAVVPRTLGLLETARLHEPTNEDIYRSIMTIHDHQHRPDAALNTYALLQAHLDNLDNTLTPEPATTALALRIRDTHTQQLRRTPSARSA